MELSECLVEGCDVKAIESSCNASADRSGSLVHVKSRVFTLETVPFFGYLVDPASGDMLR